MKNKNSSTEIPKAVAVDFDGTYIIGTPLGFVYQQNKEQFLESHGKVQEAEKEAQIWKEFLSLMDGAKGPEEWAKAVDFWRSHNKVIIEDYVPESLDVNKRLIEELQQLKQHGTKVYLVSFSPAELIEAYLKKTRDPKVEFDGVFGSVQKKFDLIKELGCTRYYTDWTPEESQLQEILGIDIVNVTETYEPILDYSTTENTLVVALLENKQLIQEALENYLQKLQSTDQADQEKSREKINNLNNLINLLRQED